MQELKLSDQLFGLYVDVLETLGEWKHVSRLEKYVSLTFEVVAGCLKSFNKKACTRAKCLFGRLDTIL